MVTADEFRKLQHNNDATRRWKKWIEEELMDMVSPDTTLIRGEEAARIADEFTITPRLLMVIVSDIGVSYHNGFKEADGEYYIDGKDDNVDEAIKYVENFLVERNYLCDIRMLGDKRIYYHVKWPAVPDSQQNQ